jgi:putative aldouronate transport system permease protein
MPLITILTVLNIGRILYADFGLFYFVPRNSGMLYRVTDVIDTYVFRALRVGDIGMSAAVGAYQSVFNLLMILTVNGLVRKFHPEYALF